MMESVWPSLQSLQGLPAYAPMFGLLRVLWWRHRRQSKRSDR
jgi:hypothetical protein